MISSDLLWLLIKDRSFLLEIIERGIAGGMSGGIIFGLVGLVARPPAQVTLPIGALIV